MRQYFVLLLVNAVFAADRYWEPDCGNSPYEDAGREIPESKIVDGYPARIYEFPWQVSLVFDNGTHFCGGSIIDPLHIITAAHCIGILEPDPEDYHVEIGKHNRTDNPSGTNEYRKRIAVEAITNHPDYSPSTYANDISVMKLKEEIDLTIPEMPYQAICKPDPANDYAGDLATVSGWGTLRSGGLVLPNTLQYTNLNVMTNEACTACIMPDIFPSSVCAGECGSNEDDSCQGDSGGPLVVKNAEGKWELIGVVSWGYGCAGARPGVYARVSSYIDWVDEIIASAN